MKPIHNGDRHNEVWVGTCSHVLMIALEIDRDIQQKRSI
jgi:hypothetical protein